MIPVHLLLNTLNDTLVECFIAGNKMGESVPVPTLPKSRPARILRPCKQTISIHLQNREMRIWQPFSGPNSMALRFLQHQNLFGGL